MSEREGEQMGRVGSGWVQIVEGRVKRKRNCEFLLLFHILLVPGTSGPDLAPMLTLSQIQITRCLKKKKNLGISEVLHLPATGKGWGEMGKNKSQAIVSLLILPFQSQGNYSLVNGSSSKALLWM